MEAEKKKGRKPKDKITRDTRATVKFSENEMKEIQELSNYLEIPKTVLIRNLTLNGLEEANSLKKLGFLKIAKGIIKSSEWLKEFKKSKNI